MKKILFFICLSMGLAFAASAQIDTTLKQYVGKYKFPEGSVVSDVTVTFDNGALTMSSAVGSSSLEKQSEDVFVITQFQGIATFKRNDAKKIIGININAGGYVLDGTKEEGSLYLRSSLWKR
ncbi:MAG: hypothetical protein IKD55_05600 [Sediminibacterium sp.]|nr:hypothetical protein [Sediminibacterium sp.]MBX9779920.1 hypothetical protein [Chitinophagaceae bacterium]